ncbi:hypothetical protein GCM10027051_19000 [Niabella terrae]
MKNLWIIGLFLGIFTGVRSQTLLVTVPGDYIQVAVGNLDQIYLLNAGSQLKKLSASGDSLAVFNEIRRFGEASQLDVSNPVKILLYSQGFATIVVLDGMLQVRQTIDLRRHQLFNVPAVGLSYDGKIWLYDNQGNNLKKIDEEGRTIMETADFRQLFDQSLNPVGIFDQHRQVYLYDSTAGIYVFDYYGSFKNRIPIQGWQHLRINDQVISGVYQNQYCRYHLDTRRYERLPLPETVAGSRQLLYRGDRLYVLNHQGLKIYRTGRAELMIPGAANGPLIDLGTGF